MNLGEGELVVILGPMFSGKSTELQRIYNRYKHVTDKIFLANFAGDIRYDPNANITSHNKSTIQSIPIKTIDEIPITSLIEYEAFFIDEAQFIELSVPINSDYYKQMVAINPKSAKDSCDEERCYIPKFLFNIGRSVIISYLNLTYDGKQFKHSSGRISDVYYISLFVTANILLTGICDQCKRQDSQFTIKKPGFQPQQKSTGVNIGTSAEYCSVCNNCRLKLL